ncbi:hypothetical protein [Nocardioides sp. TF02-7]|uniref:hypothetical protein n=1 Tax=Nocardioides sp. TF02-7 TaxID=2917724 RepID=UPI001F0632CE|nr:hypothetical protein [Nocardioides sp. TF02-7]UMG91668.1 hypothetical protein MF408_16485 [Nocardioides sp. TF02-7]
MQTRRGWELDAGPPDSGGNLRTFPAVQHPRGRAARGHLRAARGPRDAARRAARDHPGRGGAAARRPVGGRQYAERVAVLEADEESVKLALDLLPPLERRVGMLLLAAGPDAFVVDPPELDVAGVELARSC